MKKTLSILSLLIAIVLMLAGCGAGADQAMSSRSGGGSSADMKGASAEMAGLEASATPAPEGTAAPSDELMFPRKIIYTGDLRLVCEDLDVATEKLESRIKGFGAYISNASKDGTKGSVRVSTWTIRIPAEKFDPFIKFAISIGELESNNRQAQDVSEEFYDVAARLKNKQIEEARLIELLKHATGKLSEILTVEKELSRVREEIERIEGRLRFLKNQTDLSTITVTIREVKNFQPSGPPTVQTKIARSFDGSITAMKELGVAILLFLVAILPWVIPIGIVTWIIAKVRRRPAKAPVQPEIEEPKD